MTPTKPEEPRGSSQLSRLCAIMLVLLHALELLIRRIEVMACREGLYMERENKRAINGLIDGCHKVQFHMQRISDWSLGAAVTDKGECGTVEAYDVMQQDASDLLELTLWWANASHADDTARIKTLTQLKLLCRGQYIIDPQTINDLKVRITNH